MFKVPELARWKNAPDGWQSTEEDGNNGAFRLQSPESGWLLCIIASDQLGWEHVSVHAAKPGKMRTPTWKEMCYIKERFWSDEDVVMQLHPRKSQYVNNHPCTLHLWRPVSQEIPTPPTEFV